MLTKILAGAMAVLLLITGFLYWQMTSAQERATTAETALTSANAETTKANENTKELRDVITRQNELLKREREEAAKIRETAAKRELEFNRLTDDADSVAAFNDQLRHDLERGQGFKFDCDGGDQAPAGKACNGANGLQPPMTYKQFAQAAAINIGRCADAIEAIYK